MAYYSAARRSTRNATANLQNEKVHFQVFLLMKTTAPRVDQVARLVQQGQHLLDLFVDE